MTAYLFDLDGTLANTLPFILETSRLALSELGLEFDEAKVTSLIGVPLLKTGEILLGPGQGERYRDCYQKHFATLDSSSLAAFPGLDGLLFALTAAGGKLACVTSKREKPTEQTLRQIGLRQYFTVVVTADNCLRHKPEAEPALKALELLGIMPEEKAVFIGDSVFDIGCAQNAGILSCGVTWGAEKEAGLKAAGANYIAHNAAELQEILLAL